MCVLKKKSRSVYEVIFCQIGNTSSQIISATFGHLGSIWRGDCVGTLGAAGMGSIPMQLRGKWTTLNLDPL